MKSQAPAGEQRHAAATRPVRRGQRVGAVVGLLALAGCSETRPLPAKAPPWIALAAMFTERRPAVGRRSSMREGERRRQSSAFGAP